MTTLRSRTRSYPRPEALDRDVQIGLHTVTEINHAIRYADTKAAGLAGVQALALTVLVAARGPGAASLGQTALFTLCLAGVLTSACLLAAGQIPRLTAGTGPLHPNRTAFPSLATMDPGRIVVAPPLESQQAEVWRQAASLAAIAMTKYRWLRRATVSTLLTLATVLFWLALTMWLR